MENAEKWHIVLSEAIAFRNNLVLPASVSILLYPLVFLLFL
ncbi:hypothetical protein CLOSTHATH_03335 [Hungatella hathewayi DSM 13479]|uniref:Uncharacterized protein n=1 Tax=Hungatella hathewayi DSM 13479 TaxID=566550 RepID=D3AI95_9FIRM|nr:hypothetical protein CLOSTHATH_03335 [Hungatella hathewayi DSM 13479]